MPHNLRPSAFVPPGFHVENAVQDGALTTITVRHASKTSRCPSCAATANQVHSRYFRRLADLPLAGQQVRLVVIARRFRCDVISCRRAIFAERFSADVLAPWARRTARLDCLVHHLGLALGGRPAAGFARRLMFPVSNDTLLRAVRRRGRPAFLRLPSSESTIGRGSATNVTARSFAISNDAGLSAFCPTGSRRPPRRGSLVSRRLPLSQEIVAAVMRLRLPRRSHWRRRSPIAGI